MQISRVISLPEWNSDIPQKIKEYWQGRGVILHQLDDRHMVGHRGSLWGNLFSLHIAKVLTTITITRTETGFECVSDVDARYRSVTVHNRTYLELELAVFESYLLTGDLQPAAWEQHRRVAAQATAKLTGMALRHAYLRRGPMVLGGDLKLKAWILLVFAILLLPVTLRWGPRLHALLNLLTGRHRHTLPTSVTDTIFGPILAILFGVIFGGMALWMLSLRRISAACVSAEQAAESLGVTPEQVLQVIRDRHINPRFVVDGELVYEMKDLTGAAYLLRPAEMPRVEGLLRPAVASQVESQEHLLRPAGQEAAEEPPLQVQRIRPS